MRGYLRGAPELCRGNCIVHHNALFIGLFINADSLNAFDKETIGIITKPICKLASETENFCSVRHCAVVKTVKSCVLLTLCGKRKNIKRRDFSAVIVFYLFKRISPELPVKSIGVPLSINSLSLSR